MKRQQYASGSLEALQRLVGSIQPTQLIYVELFVSQHMAAFLPTGGHCGYSIAPDHIHPSYMFTVHFDDLGSIDLGGKIFHSLPDHTFALAPGVLHHEISSGIPSRFIALFLEPDFFEQELEDYKVTPRDLAMARLFPTPSELPDILRSFMLESRSTLPGRDALLKSHAVAASHACIRMLLSLQQKESVDLPENARIARTVEHIHRHLDDKLSLDRLSRVAGLSPSRFTRTFKEETGSSPLRYVQIARLDRARRMLREGGRSITEIALENGFSGSAHFSSAFHQEFGLSPSDYRRGIA